MGTNTDSQRMLYGAYFAELTCLPLTILEAKSDTLLQLLLHWLIRYILDFIVSLFAVLLLNYYLEIRWLRRTIITFAWVKLVEGGIWKVVRDWEQGELLDLIVIKLTGTDRLEATETFDRLQFYWQRVDILLRVFFLDGQILDLIQ